MSQRPNYYILLELCFDPAVDDKTKIKKAISTKQQQWSKDMNNPIKKVKASEYLALLPDIKEIMLNDKLRSNEAQMAICIRDEKIKELDRRLDLYSAKSDELSEKDLKMLLKSFSAFGFTEENIKNKFTKLIESQNKKIDLSETIDKNQAKNIKNFMQQLGKKDQTLYEFLNLSNKSSCDLLLKTASGIKAKILAKGKKTGTDNARQAICGLCAVIFKDKASKNKYDNYINLTKYYSVNDAIEEMGLSNKRIIEPKMKERLIDIAVEEYRISPSEASAYISNYCELTGFQERDKSIICGLCNTENIATSTICQNCKKTLVIVCPVCSAVNSNAAKTCAKCGFDLSKMQEAVKLIKKAKSVWIDKQADIALNYLKQAKIFWPGHQEIKPLEDEISTYKMQLTDILSSIDGFVQEGKYYHAANRIKQAQNREFLIDEKISNAVFSKLEYVKQKLESLKNMDKDSAFEILSDLISEVKDSEDAKKLLENYPPLVPENLNYKINENAVEINWEESKSVGQIEYILVKKQGSYANDINDGEKIYEGGECRYSDSDIVEAKAYYYTVFASRLGLNSKAAHLKEKVVLVKNVSNIKAVGGDGFVVLSWEKPETLTEVKIWKYEGNEKPNSTKDCEIVECNRTDGIKIDGLENDKRYWFYISSGHSINAEEYYSGKILIYAVPCKIASPIENLNIKRYGNVFDISFSKPKWDVIFFYSDEKPDYVEATVYPLNEISKKYKALNVTLKGEGKAEFILDFVGKKYIIPAQVNATNIILNEATCIANVPEPSNISYSFSSARTELYINFDWPQGVDKVLLAYSFEDYPKSATDPLVKKIFATKKQYERNDGILILSPKEQDCYVSLYTICEDDNSTIYSRPAKTLINSNEQIEIFYSFKYKKSMFSHSTSLSLNIRAKGNFIFPEFCIVSKFKSVALNRSDGDIICINREKTKVSDSHTFEFGITELRKDSKLRLFLLDDSQYSFFKLINEASNSI